MVSYPLLVNKKTISRKNDNNNEFQNKSVWNTFFNCIIQSHILHIRTIFLIIWAANKRHTDSYCNNKLFWYNLEDIGNERTKLRGRADDLAKIRVFSRNFFFSVKLPKSNTCVFTDFSFSVKSHKSRRGFRGEDCYKGLFFVVGSFNSIDFFQGCFL